MPSWTSLWQKCRFPVAILLLSSLYSSWISRGLDTRRSLLSKLNSLGIFPKRFAVTYRTDHEELQMYQRIGKIEHSENNRPDVTAVVLNWSRFPNVLLISSLLCGPWLEDVIAEVFIWNNSPRKISYDNFEGTGCSRKKIKIYNSPTNMYFQARFLACAQANTPYCFIQDDDYLILPEIIHTLHSRLMQSEVPHTVHLLPPHEHLSSTLRELHIPSVDHPKHFDIHTSFAWLGHGAMLHRSEAVDFLSLLHSLNVSDEEIKMADNYYTILSNRVPEIWLDQGIELGGGQPFTVGSEGDQRNTRHILRAAQYLDRISRRDELCGILPYVSFESPTPSTSQTHAACRGVSCLLSTNIGLLPNDMVHMSSNISDILITEDENLRTLERVGKVYYLEHPPSAAVDGNPLSFFESLSVAQTNDHISLDFPSTAISHIQWPSVEMVWLVDIGTERILRASWFSYSVDGTTWCLPLDPNPVRCHDVFIDRSEEKGDVYTADADFLTLRECSVKMDVGAYDPLGCGGARFFLAQLNEDVNEKWKVHEVWVRAQ